MNTSTNTQSWSAVLLRACLMAFIGLNINLNLNAAESVPPPPEHSGTDRWGSYLTTVEASIIARIPAETNLPSVFDKNIWGGWFANHAIAMISEPAAYAEWDHDSWLRVVTAYGVLGRGNFYDPLLEKSRESMAKKVDVATGNVAPDTDEHMKQRQVAFEELTKGVPFYLFANIPQIDLLKDESNQDAFWEEIKKHFDLLFQFMPYTHRDGYVQLGRRVEEVISQPGWYERELAYYTATLDKGTPHFFVRFGPDGKPDPFRKGIAFMFRRVHDKTVTVERAKSLLARANDFFGRIHVREGENTHVHNPKPLEEKKGLTKDEFFEKLQEDLKKIEETK